MNIKEITITATATKNYQKYEISITGEDFAKGDIENLRNQAIAEAKRGIDLLCPDNAPAQVETKTQPIQYMNTPRAPRVESKPITQGQIDFFKRSGLDKRYPDYQKLTCAQASDIIKQPRG